MFDNLKKEIKLFKVNGEIIDRVKAIIQSEKIFIDYKANVERGDYFEWINPLGNKEKMIIDSVDVLLDFSGDFHHIEIKYHKEKI